MLCATFAAVIWDIERPTYTDLRRLHAQVISSTLQWSFNLDDSEVSLLPAATRRSRRRMLAAVGGRRRQVCLLVRLMIWDPEIMDGC